ncbi:hypothetical protein KJ815_10635, partial [bacterium]|nr:hypothetical protein [bacterium]
HNCSLPTLFGRCCYGSPTSPSCQDSISVDDCNVLGGTWTYNLNCVANPCPVLPGDNCSDAVLLTGTLPITVTGNTTGLTNDYTCVGLGATAPAGWYPVGSYYSETSTAAAPDAAYHWIAPATATFKITMCNAGSDYDQAMLIYNYTCPTEPLNPGDFIAGCDDLGSTLCALSSLRAGVEVALSQNQHILIIVDGYSTNVGNFELTISQNP